MFNRWIEDRLLDVLENEGIGSIAFSPLAQGLLTNKYLNGIPQDSRVANKKALFFNETNITEEKLNKIKLLNEIAENRCQTLAQMALSWVLQNVTSVIIGASRLSQITENVKAIEKLDFTKEELEKIDRILK
ncbi:MAG: L-glyceraldehyde 3-phosphate reductase [Fusobacteriaceae bacterium]|jgi:L-glyceraldehyde 3-phosphate reductase|nr:NADP-dependent oxidoreductase domain protein [Fusobacteriales bacterium]MDN5303811.1 L-glyceraldehyde 3-phosphate reductase [Fusobacteriaceae bacterium]